MIKSEMDPTGRRNGFEVNTKELEKSVPSMKLVSDFGSTRSKDRAIIKTKETNFTFLLRSFFFSKEFLSFCS